MPDALAIALAAGGLLAGVLFGLGCLLWARRQVADARRQVAAARWPPPVTPKGLERALRSGQKVMRTAVRTATRVRDHGVVGILDELALWAEKERPDLRRMAARDGTVTIMFSDIVDSTITNERLGDRSWVKLLGVHDSVVRARVERHEGFVVKSQGDGFMVAFADPAAAIGCAASVQRAISGGDRRLRKEPLQVRIGVHIGTAVERNGDLFGRNVALAARVATAADGGQILVSEPVAERVRERDDIVLVRPRELELKGLPGQHVLYEVQW